MTPFVEVWRPVTSYEGLYEVSNLGRVKSLIRGKILSTHLNKGYAYVGLHKETKQKVHKVHRLVAEAFIPNPENKTDINHKDYDRANNNVKNLEWMTRRENINYSSKRMRHPKKYKTNTGEHHITFDKNKKLFRVGYWEKGMRKDKCFKAFDKAIEFRNEKYKETDFAR